MSEIVVRIERKTGILIIGAMAVIVGGFALAETLTLTTSYPVPSGIYNQLITTGNSGSVFVDTTLNRNAGNTILVPSTNTDPNGGKVGVGTTSPKTMLDLAGLFRPGSYSSDAVAPSGVEGALYYNTSLHAFRGFENGIWSSIGGDPLAPLKQLEGVGEWPSYVACAYNGGYWIFRMESIKDGSYGIVFSAMAQTMGGVNPMLSYDIGSGSITSIFSPSYSGGNGS